MRKLSHIRVYIYICICICARFNDSENLAVRTCVANVKENKTKDINWKKKGGIFVVKKKGVININI